MKFSESFDTSYLKRILLYVLTILLGIGVMIYLGYHLMERFSARLELVDAVPHTVTKTVSADAYIMRDETPLYAGSTSNGSVASAVRSGERVQAYGKVADLYAVSSPQTERRLEELKELTALLEKNLADDRSVQTTVSLESDIYDGIFDMVSHNLEGNYGDAVSLRTALLLNIKRRDILTGEVTDYSTQIAALKREEDELKASLGACLETVTTPIAGYYFSTYDDYGSVFSSEQVDTMTYDDFNAKMNAEPEQHGGVCVGTMVRDYKWYIACEMPKTDAAPLVDLTRCTVTFPYSGTSLPMTLYRSIPQTPGERTVLVFRCEKVPVGFDYTRVQPVEIEAASYTGYEIPAEAIRVKNTPDGDSYMGVYILDEVTVDFRRIEIIYEEDGRAICVGNDEKNAEVLLAVQAARAERAEELFGTLRDDAIRKGKIVTAEVEAELHAEATAQAKTEVTAASIGMDYWIEQNDVVIVSGRGLETGKVMGGAK